MGPFLAIEQMIKVDESNFLPLFDWCNSNGDSEVDREELIDCSMKGSEYFEYFDDMPNKYMHEYMHKLRKNYIYTLVRRYWRLIDNEYSSMSYSWSSYSLSLSFDEFKYTMAGLASVDAGLILKVRKKYFLSCPVETKRLLRLIKNKV